MKQFLPLIWTLCCVFSSFSQNQSRPSRYLPENKVFETALFEKYKNKVLRPSLQEIELNKRSRSAKMRYAIRSKNKFEYPKNLFKKFKKYLDLEALDA